MSARLVSRLSPTRTALFLCDMQEKFRNSVQYFPQIVEVSRRMLNIARILKMPVIATEQYPKGLGRTVVELGLYSSEALKPVVVEKTCFSMFVADLQKQLSKDVDSVLLCGIEAHACVLQTVLDLIENGYKVHVVVDACSSRGAADRWFAFRRMEKEGARLTTSESAALELLRDAAHPDFKAVQKIILESAPDTGLLPFIQAKI